VLGMDKEDKRNEWQSLDSLHQVGGRAKPGMVPVEQNGEEEEEERVPAKSEKGILTTEHNRNALGGFDKALSRFGGRGKGGEQREGQGRGRGWGGGRGGRGRGRGRGRGGVQKEREPFSMVRRGEGLIGDRGLKFD
jgi:hypothetical protein